MITRKSLRNLLIYLSLTLLGLYMAAFQRSLDDIGRYFEFMGAFTGLLVTSHFAGIFIMPLISGELADKYGRRVIICTGFALLLGGLALSIVSNHIFLYILAIFFIGGGFGIVEGIMTTVLVDLNKERGRAVINISQVFFCIGALAGPLITSLFISIGYTWRSIYGIFAVVSLFYMIYFLRLPMVNVKATVEKIKGTIVLHLLKKPILIMLSISILMYVGVEQGAAFWIGRYTGTMTDSTLMPSIILSAFWGFMILGRILFGVLLGKGDIIKTIIWLTAFSCLALGVVIAADNYIISWIGFALLGLSMSAIWPLIVVLANRFFGEFRATAFGIMMACSALGGMIIPFIAGVIGETLNFKLGMGFFIIPLLAIIACQVMVRRRTILQVKRDVEIN